jgi:isoamyl acetate esterase
MRASLSDQFLSVPISQRAPAMENPTPSPRAEASLRRRRTFILTGVAFVFLAAMIVVLASATGGSSSSSTTSSSSSSKSSLAGTNGKSAPSHGAATGNTPARRQSIVVLGDSSTQYGGSALGWETLLHEAYVRILDTFNRGLSGYNTRIFLEHAMPGIIEEVRNYYKPAVVVLWFGVNDATLANGPNKAQHVPLDEYKENLIEMIKQFREAAPDSQVLLLSPGYIDEKQRLKSMLSSGRKASDPLDRNNAETMKYAKACGEIFDSKFKDDGNVGFINVYDYFQTTYPTDENKTNILRDGLHFSSVGDRIFYELVNAKIEQMVPSDVLSTRQFPNDNAYIAY